MQINNQELQELVTHIYNEGYKDGIRNGRELALTDVYKRIEREIVNLRHADDERSDDYIFVPIRGGLNGE